jgi:hypothetical protein
LRVFGTGIRKFESCRPSELPVSDVRTGGNPWIQSAKSLTGTALYQVIISSVCHGPRDLAIFQRPAKGEQIEILEIRDPYACAGRRARENLVEFAAIMLS